MSSIVGLWEMRLSFQRMARIKARISRITLDDLP
jgi:hypothetical protein